MQTGVKTAEDKAIPDIKNGHMFITQKTASWHAVSDYNGGTSLYPRTSNPCDPVLNRG